MKKIAILTSVIAALTFGCATTSNTANEQLIVQSLAAAGAEAIIAQYPQYAPDVPLVVAVLDDLSGSPTPITVAQAQTVLAQAGQTNPAINLVVPLIVNLLNTYTGTNSTLTGTSQQVVSWVAAGLAQGYQISVPAAPKLTLKHAYIRTR